MHRRIGGCKGPGVIWTADVPKKNVRLNNNSCTSPAVARCVTIKRIVELRLSSKRITIWASRTSWVSTGFRFHLQQNEKQTDLCIPDREELISTASHSLCWRNSASCWRHECERNSCVCHVWPPVWKISLEKWDALAGRYRQTGDLSDTEWICQNSSQKSISAFQVFCWSWKLAVTSRFNHKYAHREMTSYSDLRMKQASCRSLDANHQLDNEQHGDNAQLLRHEIKPIA